MSSRRKRKNSTLAEVTKIPKASSCQEACWLIYNAIRSRKNDKNELICEPFIKLPKKRNDQVYTLKIANSMDLQKIHQKIKSEIYISVDEMIKDLNLIISNMKLLYLQNSNEYKQINEFWKLVCSVKNDVEYSADTQSDDENTDEENEDLDEENNSSNNSHKDLSEDNDVTNEDDETKLDDDDTKLEDDYQSDDGTNMKVPVLKLKVVSNDMPPAAVKEISTDGDDTRMSSFSELEDRNETFSENVIIPKKRGKRPKKDLLINVATITDPSLLEDFFTFVINATDDDRSISEVFKILPSIKKLADYYSVIKEPIDLRMIARKLQNSRYHNLDELNNDLILMIQNAKTFNAPGSQIYKDACLLRKLIIAKKSEIENTKSNLMPMRSQRIKEKAVSSNTALSSVIAGLDSDSEIDAAPPTKVSKIEEVINNNVEDVNIKSNLQTLFNAVINYKDSFNQSIIEPFLRLPSRRMYADYYLEIETPFSIMKVQKKLDNNQYPDLDSLVEDMNLVFNNAMQYNREDSKIYNDADLLQQFMMTKKKELDGSKDDSLIKSEDDVIEIQKERKRRGKPPNINSKKSQLRFIKSIIDYQIDGRYPAILFKDFSSKTDSPGYYKSIKEPIDLTTIEKKIKSDKYLLIMELLVDLKLMFTNAKQYNDENSLIYTEAVTLENYLQEKVNELGVKLSEPIIKKVVSEYEPEDPEAIKYKQLLIDFYNQIKNFTDDEDRVLSIPFMKLPSKSDYPDYYEIVRKPIDMQKIWSKISSISYGTPDDMLCDIALMFENACRYNEPDSVIYQDALILLRYSLDQREIIFDDKDLRTAPNVKLIVSQLLANLYKTTYNYQNAEGRFLRFSIIELQANTNLTFEVILERVNKNFYKRLDELQKDFFTMLMQVRHISAFESKVFQDSITLQKFFIQQRTKIFHKILISPAMDFIEEDLDQEIERLKIFKVRDTIDDLDDSSHDDDVDIQVSLIQPGDMDQYEINGTIYYRGDYVYVEPRESGLDPHIVCIGRMYRSESNEPWLHGSWFLRPNETIHLPTRTFMSKEVFKSDFSDSVPFSKVLKKCFILGVKDYSNFIPEGFSDDDIYVCESRYTGRNKVFTRIKCWKGVIGSRVQLIPRQTGLHGNFGTLQRKSVPANNVSNAEIGCDYFEQIQTANCWVKLGDYIYLKKDAGKPIIVHVDKIWKTKDGKGFFTGNYYFYPQDVAHVPTHLFLNKEVFISSLEQTYSLEKILGHCYVLTPKDYCLCRPTHIPEVDIFICDTKYLDKVKMFKKCKPTKRVNISSQSLQDEWFYFESPIFTSKVASHLLFAETATTYPIKKVKEVEEIVPAAISEELSFIENNLDIEAIVGRSGKPKRKKTYSVTGYIVYASEVRKDIANENPAYNFGEVSREVGNRWKSLPKIEKEKYEEKARILMAAFIANSVNNEINSIPSIPSPDDSRSISPPILPQTKSKFVSLPPRVQPIVHSETYIRYLERLTNGASTITNIKKGLTANKPVNLTDSVLPAHWLANGPDHHEDVVSALWALRNHMLKDALIISNY